MSDTNGNRHPSTTIPLPMQGTSLAVATTDVQSAALVAQAEADIKARWLIAQHARRNWDQVRVDLVRECKRPSFAEVARYHKPVGDGVEGPSIRFVEAALAAMGNICSKTTVIFDSPEKRVVEVSVTDLERNVTHPKQVTIVKRVERSKLRKGQIALGTRTNSRGHQVYIVEATDDEILDREGALVSKALRTCGLRVIPGWLVEEAMAQVAKTQSDSAAKDPDAERRKLTDAFASLGVQPADLAEYLGHDLAKIAPAELLKLRAIYSAIRDGETTWVAIMEHARRDEDDSPAAPETTAPSADATPGRGTRAVKAALRRERDTAPVDDDLMPDLVAPDE